MDSKWRIEQLSHGVAQALESGQYAGQESARVRDVPDVRTIRYYTTLGLVDRPLEMQGRTAFYGRRHLLQLVAIKRLQAQGLSLVEVQQTLLGASDAKLEQLAALPEGFLAEALSGTTAQHTVRRKVVPGDSAARSENSEDTTAPARSFWAQAPQWTEGETVLAPPPSFAGAVVMKVDTGISLLLEGVSPEQMTPETIAALEPAVDMLRNALQRTLGNGQTTKPDPTQETPE